MAGSLFVAVTFVVCVVSMSLPSMDRRLRIPLRLLAVDWTLIVSVPPPPMTVVAAPMPRMLKMSFEVPP